MSCKVIIQLVAQRLGRSFFALRVKIESQFDESRLRGNYGLKSDTDEDNVQPVCLKRACKPFMQLRCKYVSKCFVSRFVRYKKVFVQKELPIKRCFLLFKDQSWKNFILAIKNSDRCIFKVKVSALLLKTYQKLFVIMMMTKPGQPFEHMFQGGKGCI